MGEELERALRYRNYAAELRVIADENVTPNYREFFETAADDYERMASALEAVERSMQNLRKRR